MTYAVGIDFGGTNIKAVAVSPNGEILRRFSVPTHDDRESVIRAVKDATTQFAAQFGPTEILGLAAPGMAARDDSKILYMAGWCVALVGLEWAPTLNWPRFVPIWNDAHAHLLGESWLGSARGCQNAILLTLGTGVGGATLCDGKILKGHTGRAGHLGHISLDFRGAGDIFRTPGSLENQIGTCSLLERSGGQFGRTHELLEAAQNGDENAQTLWRESVHALAAGLVSLINCFDPEKIILSGGIINAKNALFDPLGEFLDAMEWRPLGEAVPVVPAILGDFAGAIGAAKNALEFCS